MHMLAYLHICRYPPFEEQPYILGWGGLTEWLWYNGFFIAPSPILGEIPKAILSWGKEPGSQCRLRRSNKDF